MFCLMTVWIECLLGTQTATKKVETLHGKDFATFTFGIHCLIFLIIV